MSFEAIYKGYPYGKPVSEKLEISESHFNLISQQPKEIVALFKDVINALKDAEDQIRDLQATYPFIPENYGFVKMTNPPGANADENKNFQTFTSYTHPQIPGKILTKDTHTGESIYYIISEDTSTEGPLRFENTHIAYAYLNAKGWYVPQEGNDMVVTITDEEVLEEMKSRGEETPELPDMEKNPEEEPGF